MYGLGRQHRLKSSSEPKLEQMGLDDDAKNAPRLLPRKAPQKPSRVPSLRNKVLVRPSIKKKPKPLPEDADERDYSDYDQARSEPSWLKSTQRNMPLPLPPPSEKIQNTPDLSDDYSALDYDTMLDLVLPPQSVSAIRVDGFYSVILPFQNKPLDSNIALQIVNVICASNARDLALHITMCDIQLLKLVGHHEFGLSVHSGLELICLPQGFQICEDMCEHVICLSYFLFLLMLLQADNRELMSKFLAKLVAVCSELLSMDHLGLSAIMEVISPSTKQGGAKCLQSIWQMLEKENLSSADEFRQISDIYNEIKHGSMIQSNEDTCAVPYLVPSLYMCQRLQEWLLSDKRPRFLLNNEELHDVLPAQLSSLRSVVPRMQVYERNGKAIIRKFVKDDFLKEILSTEFQMRFLWGSNGCTDTRQNRHKTLEGKLTQMLAYL